ncbi:sensor histidine kinase [Thaumasiovibrio subtropicus]|uniref:sensor histidine kinase n=1 Tax=Thaumasiovibrio subtropicus TaxID=1891207 RepID=UPI000B34E43E|nr:ATP-binding protein [Thaumasiovibrio subtropicus]
MFLNKHFGSKSIATRLNLILILLAAIIVTITVVVISIGNRIQESSAQLSDIDLPTSLNALAMLDELGDMNANLLEYSQGEYEERQEFVENYNELKYFQAKVPDHTEFDFELAKIIRLSSAMLENANKNVFDTYDPTIEARARAEIERLLVEVGGPLEDLLEELKIEELNDAGTSGDTDEIINDDLPGVRFYLELVDEVGDMLAALDRYVLGDTGAKKTFFEDALEFELYLSQLIPLEQKPAEIVKIKEVQRLFNVLKTTAEDVFDTYNNLQRQNALRFIDSFEHNELRVLEDLLEKISLKSSNALIERSEGLQSLANTTTRTMLAIAAVGLLLMASIYISVRRNVFLPLQDITSSIDKLRAGDRDVEFNSSGDDELGRVLASLKDFQSELAELDALRERNEKQQAHLSSERDRLSETLETLQATQEKLVASEKLAALGSLVAGVAHEINTPIGVAVTMSTTLEHNLKQFLDKVNSGQIKKTDLEAFSAQSGESVDVLKKSLNSASELIANFKQVASDQTSEQRRSFDLQQHIDEVYVTLKHKVKNTNYNIRVDCPEDIMLESYPGPLGQVLTNLINNSLLHGFEGKDSGNIQIKVRTEGHSDVRIIYTDDGNGIPQENLKRIFDPFFTTKLGKGGSGMGLHILHNIVTGVLGGSISVESKVGVLFDITIPRIAPQSEQEVA